MQVHAVPAIKLLWHQADRVVIRLGRYRSAPGPLGNSLGQTADVGSLDASAREVDAGLLTLRDAVLRKRGDTLTGTAVVTEADLRASLPIIQSLTPVASGGGQLTLQGTASLFGVTATVDATVKTQNGSLVVVPDVPFGGLATIKVFSNPHIDVQSVSAGAGARRILGDRHRPSSLATIPPTGCPIAVCCEPNVPARTAGLWAKSLSCGGSSAGCGAAGFAVTLTLRRLGSGGDALPHHHSCIRF